MQKTDKKLKTLEGIAFILIAIGIYGLMTARADVPREEWSKTPLLFPAGIVLFIITRVLIWWKYG